MLINFSFNLTKICNYSNLNSFSSFNGKNKKFLFKFDFNFNDIGEIANFLITKLQFKFKIPFFSDMIIFRKLCKFILNW